MTSLRPHSSPSPLSDRHDLAAAALEACEPSPVEGECLVCFAARVGCGPDGICGGWAVVERYRLGRAPAALGLPGRLARLGADCAAGLVAPRHGRGDEAVWALGREHLERDVHDDRLRVPDPLPACHGVRPGSAQPCGLWARGPAPPDGGAVRLRLCAALSRAEPR